MRTSWPIGWALLAVVMAGCTAPLTELVVVVDTDYPVPTGLEDIEIVVTEPDGTVETVVASLATTSLPVTLGVVHRGGALDPLRIAVAGRRGGSTVVHREAITGFIAGETREIRLDLLQVCGGDPCAAELTCLRGACVSLDVPASSLPRFTGTVSRLDGGSFDADLFDGGLFDADLFDAGLFDAGLFDAGLFDAGLFDGGIDVALFDAGALDAGELDAGEHDAGELDAGELDAGELDAGELDAGELDAGELDAGSDACVAGAEACDADDDDCDGRVDEGACICTPTCVLDHATAICTSMRTCAIASCDTGFSNCDALPETGCERSIRTLSDCGACGRSCASVEGTTTCADGTCRILTCADFLRDDCNGDIADGCETRIDNDPNNCGMCGMVCTTGMRRCTNGICR